MHGQRVAHYIVCCHRQDVLTSTVNVMSHVTKMLLKVIHETSGDKTNLETSDKKRGFPKNVWQTASLAAFKHSLVAICVRNLFSIRAIVPHVLSPTLDNFWALQKTFYMRS